MGFSMNELRFNGWIFDLALFICRVKVIPKFFRSTAADFLIKFVIQEKINGKWENYNTGVDFCL